MKNFAGPPLVLIASYYAESSVVRRDKARYDMMMGDVDAWTMVSMLERELSPADLFIITHDPARIFSMPLSPLSTAHTPNSE